MVLIPASAEGISLHINIGGFITSSVVKRGAKPISSPCGKRVSPISATDAAMVWWEVIIHAVETVFR